ncbi:uncharacterized protein PHACADRAFT_31203 [Phanerochaete carnosa HHB-10118-sp]|uniref:C2H2-type domain-containing protein n=1 Tax=Phanerochaete carnosa (strain HHB-10118-sp) TaxID=650164 RepID=K5WQU2_PHACS|nr:uncharacterized protein PHACADRAFT_31203 [Phanerochaete carnosa HHB-10118-sp]EKM52737.1 hypothetical protein PHACADRAFT_31203 [Phanerochaete carnosa HHB-10118-sp]
MNPHCISLPDYDIAQRRGVLPVSQAEDVVHTSDFCQDLYYPEYSPLYNSGSVDSFQPFFFGFHGAAQEVPVPSITPYTRVPGMSSSESQSHFPSRKGYCGQASGPFSALQDTPFSPLHAPLSTSSRAHVSHFTYSPGGAHTTSPFGPRTSHAVQLDATNSSSLHLAPGSITGTSILVLGFETTAKHNGFNALGTEPMSSAGAKRAEYQGSPYSCTAICIPPNYPAPSAKVKRITRRMNEVVFTGAIPEPKTTGPDAWRCMHCDYVQESKFLNNLKRHIAAHYPLSVVCKGVPLKDAPQYSVIDTGDVMEWDGELRVGGCFSGFSRRDALLRHLGNPNVSCVGETGVTTRLRKSSARE